jgi:hypothetical protein
MKSKGLRALGAKDTGCKYESVECIENSGRARVGADAQDDNDEIHRPANDIGMPADLPPERAYTSALWLLLLLGAVCAAFGECRPLSWVPCSRIQRRST